MSQENVERLYRAYDAFNRRDIDAFLALADAEIEFTTLNLQLEGGLSYRGHDGVRSYWENMISVFPDFNVVSDEVRDLGDVTLVRGRLRGHGVESDASFEQRFWQTVKWRDEKCIWWHIFRSEGEALESAGLRE
jgi:ketosteroid isomerase-like protein